MNRSDIGFGLFKLACKGVLPHPDFQKHEKAANKSYKPDLLVHFIYQDEEWFLCIPYPISHEDEIDINHYISAVQAGFDTGKKENL